MAVQNPELSILTLHILKPRTAIILMLVIIVFFQACIKVEPGLFLREHQVKNIWYIINLGCYCMSVATCPGVEGYLVVLK